MPAEGCLISRQGTNFQMAPRLIKPPSNICDAPCNPVRFRPAANNTLIFTRVSWNKLQMGLAKWTCTAIILTCHNKVPVIILS